MYIKQTMYYKTREPFSFSEGVSSIRDVVSDNPIVSWVKKYSASIRVALLTAGVVAAAYVIYTQATNKATPSCPRSRSRGPSTVHLADNTSLDSTVSPASYKLY